MIGGFSSAACCELVNTVPDATAKLVAFLSQRMGTQMSPVDDKDPVALLHFVLSAVQNQRAQYTNIQVIRSVLSCRNFSQRLQPSSLSLALV